jgi:ABC-2 type transport system permease protein
LALAMLSTAFANLAIATGFDRSYGVLKRLGSTPLGRGRLVAAKTLATVTLLALQAAVLVPIALGLGWRPDVETAPLLVAIGLGTVSFCGLAMLLAGRLSAMVTLATANAVFVSLLVLSGMVVPLDRLPSVLSWTSRALPSTALTEAFHGSLDHSGSVPARVWPVLALWALGTTALAVNAFRWDPDH